MFIAPKLCHSLTQETYRIKGERSILVLGSHPTVVGRLIKRLRPEDKLVICEPHDNSFIKLRRLLSQRKSVRGVREQISLYNVHPWELNKEIRANSIIITQNMALLNDDAIEHIMQAMQSILLPEGNLSCCEYAFYRRLRRFSLANGNFIRRERTVDTMDHYVDSFRNYKETVWNAFCPMWVHNLHFTPQRTAYAVNRLPSEERYSFTACGLKFSKDIWKFAPWLSVLALFLRRLGKSFWFAPLFLLSALAAFFRDPSRSVKAQPDEVLSACDGEVMDVSTVSEPCMGPTPWLRISAFLSITNTHINRAPVAGRVIEQFDVEGRHVSANKYRAVHNHSCYTVFETDYGQVVVAQRVGFLARRIFNWVGRGEVVAQGERYGLIRLGSRTDIYLPLNRYEVLVNAGDKIKAGCTVVARRLPSSEVIPSSPVVSRTPIAATEMVETEVDPGE